MTSQPTPGNAKKVQDYFNRYRVERGSMVVVHLVAACLLVLAMAPPASRAQEPEAAAPPTATEEEAPPTIDTTNDAGEDDDTQPRRRLVKWNEYEGPISTFRLGFGLMLDAATYSQDAESEQQVSIDDPGSGVRDSRLLFRGRFQTERAVLLDVRLHVRQCRRLLARSADRLPDRLSRSEGDSLHRPHERRLLR